jgi:hypothetical protein
MAKVFRPYQPDQILMLPPSLQEWLPADHEVYFVTDLTNALDLSEIYSHQAPAHCIYSLVALERVS